MLLKNNTTIIRVLKSHGDRSLVIDCIKRTMPKWFDSFSLSDFVKCTEADLYALTGAPQNRQLSPEEQRIAQERYTMIAPVLPFIGNEQKRIHIINLVSEHQSKQTVRKYLCLYLVYQTVEALAPARKVMDRELSNQEKTYRWALNKFYYTQQKQTLTYTYNMMLKSRYTDPNGKLLWDHRPLTDFWRIGAGTEKKLRDHGLTTLRSVAMCNEDLLYKLFGKDAELLIDHAWGANQ